MSGLTDVNTLKASGAVDVSGVTTLTDVNVLGTIVINDTTQESIKIKGTFDSSGTANFQKIVANDRTQLSDTDIHGPLAITGGFSSDGEKFTIANGTGDTVINAKLTTQGETVLQNNLRVSGLVDICGNTTIGGILNIGSLNTSGLDVTGNSVLGGTISVAGASTLTGALTAHSTGDIKDTLTLSLSLIHI